MWLKNLIVPKIKWISIKINDILQVETVSKITNQRSHMNTAGVERAWKELVSRSDLIGKEVVFDNRVGGCEDKGKSGRSQSRTATSPSNRLKSKLLMWQVTLGLRTSSSRLTTSVTRTWSATQFSVTSMTIAKSASRSIK